MGLRKPLRQWGNAFGIMVSRTEARRLGLHVGEMVDVELQRHAPARVTDLPSLHAGDTTDLDRLLARDHADP